MEEIDGRKGRIGRRPHGGREIPIPDPLSPDTPKDRVLRWLAEGEIRPLGVVPWGSNYTFLAAVYHDAVAGLAIYKPQRGEQPLWDFPEGTLCYREVAAYVVSEALGWGLVPPTVLREHGPYGRGALQLFIDADPDAHYFTFRDEPPLQPTLMRLAVFDLIANNADRKAGHCLRDRNGRVWAIDHGICFHAEPKLRTVIWAYQGQPIPEDIVAEVRAFYERLRGDAALRAELDRLLSAEEMRALERRTADVLVHPVFPRPGPWRAVPWPMI